MIPNCRKPLAFSHTPEALRLYPPRSGDTDHMPLYRDQGVVLRCHKLGEADRIVTVLTRDYGLVRAVAKGVRRTTSGFGARLEPLGHIDVQFHTGRSLDVVTQVETISAFGSVLAGDYGSWTAGQAMAEAAEKVVGEQGEPARQQYWLLVAGLRALVQAEHEHGLILDAFLLRSLSVAGWAPSFDACVRCGEPGPHRAFHIGAGGALCRSCRIPGSAAPSPSAFELMSALLTGDWEAADAAEARTRRETSGLVAAYSQWHLERKLRSLPLVERERPDRLDEPQGAPSVAVLEDATDTATA